MSRERLLHQAQVAAARQAEARRLLLGDAVGDRATAASTRSPLRTRSIRSSSTQPPETEPTTRPSSRIASSAPGGRGAEPQVSITVTSQTLWPAARQSRAWASTWRSRLSMRTLLSHQEIAPTASTTTAPISHQTVLLPPRRVRRRDRRCRLGRLGSGRVSGRCSCASKALKKSSVILPAAASIRREPTCAILPPTVRARVVLQQRLRRRRASAPRRPSLCRSRRRRPARRS